MNGVYYNERWLLQETAIFLQWTVIITRNGDFLQRTVIIKSTTIITVNGDFFYNELPLLQ